MRKLKWLRSPKVWEELEKSDFTLINKHYALQDIKVTPNINLKRFADECISLLPKEERPTNW